MFRKQGVCISTAAGAGMKSTNKDMGDSLFFWGVGRIYQYGCAVAATSWEQITPKKRAAIDRSTTAIAAKIRRRAGHVCPSLKTKMMFGVMRMFQRNGFNPKDVEYWKEKGWLGSARPWN